MQQISNEKYLIFKLFGRKSTIYGKWGTVYQRFRRWRDKGARADCKEAIHLIEGISAEVLLVDRGYDTDRIISYAVTAGMKAVIPAKRNRKEQR